MNENYIHITRAAGSGMKLVFCVLLTSAFAITANSQSPSKVLKQAEKAIGGATAFQAIRSTVQTGKVKRVSDGAVGRYNVQAAQPNRFNVAFDLDGFEIESGFNGKSGWTRNSRDGLQTLTGAASLNFQAEAAFRNNLWFNAKKDKSKLVAAGQSVINGKQATAVAMITAKGVTIKMFFDAATGLLLRDEISAADVVTSRDYGGYRDVGGRKFAFSSRLTTGDEVYEIALDDVAVNRPVTLAAFDFPIRSS